MRTPYGHCFCVSVEESDQVSRRCAMPSSVSKMDRYGSRSQELRSLNPAWLGFYGLFRCRGSGLYACGSKPMSCLGLSVSGRSWQSRVEHQILVAERACLVNLDEMSCIIDPLVRSAMG